jgi:hypothetical protein
MAGSFTNDLSGANEIRSIAELGNSCEFAEGVGLLELLTQAEAELELTKCDLSFHEQLVGK